MSTSSAAVASRFGQRLAHTEKKYRDQALKKLTAYLGRKRAWSPLEWDKLWKALFYCMWMSDKRAVQMELARNLARLVHKIPARREALAFVRSFLRTMHREWHGLDGLRLDKFYDLVRQFVRETVALLAAHKFPRAGVTELADMLSAEVVSQRPNGLRMHLADLYLAEICGAAGQEIETGAFLLLLEPFFTMLGSEYDQSVFKRARDLVFLPMLSEFQFGEAAKAAAEKKSEEETDGEGEEESVRGFPRVDLARVQHRIFAIAAAEGTAERNRASLYELYGKFAAVTEVDSLKVAQEEALNPTPEEDEAEEDAEMEEAEVETPVAEDAPKKKKKKKSKKRKQEQVDASEPEELENEADEAKPTEEAPPSKKAKKAKKQVKEADVAEASKAKKAKKHAKDLETEETSEVNVASQEEAIEKKKKAKKTKKQADEQAKLASDKKQQGQQQQEHLGEHEAAADASPKKKKKKAKKSVEAEPSDKKTKTEDPPTEKKSKEDKPAETKAKMEDKPTEKKAKKEDKPAEKKAKKEDKLAEKNAKKDKPTEKKAKEATEDKQPKKPAVVVKSGVKFQRCATCGGFGKNLVRAGKDQCGHCERTKKTQKKALAKKRKAESQRAVEEAEAAAASGKKVTFGKNKALPHSLSVKRLKASATKDAVPKDADIKGVLKASATVVTMKSKKTQRKAAADFF